MASALTERDIKKLKKMVDNDKPLRELEYSTILPYLQICCKNKLKNKMKNQAKAKLAKQQTNTTESAIVGGNFDSSLFTRSEIAQNVFIRYGLGINSFFALMRSLVKAYCILAAIAILQMAVLYWNNRANSSVPHLQKISIASYPYSRPICKHTLAQLKRVSVSCEGSDVIQKVFDYGFLPLGGDHGNLQERCILEDVRRNDKAYQTHPDFTCDRDAKRGVKEETFEFEHQKYKIKSTAWDQQHRGTSKPFSAYLDATSKCKKELEKNTGGK